MFWEVFSTTEYPWCQCRGVPHIYIDIVTNIVIRLFKNDPEITNTLVTVTTFCLPIPVVAELVFAARNSSRQKENLFNNLFQDILK